MVYDMYKRPKRKVPTMGGLAILCGLMIALVFCQVFVDEVDLMRLLVFYFVVLLFGGMGLLVPLSGIYQIASKFVQVALYERL